jgi:diguanylate cyclase (GGDEF)-like protein
MSELFDGLKCDVTGELQLGTKTAMRGSPVTESKKVDRMATRGVGLREWPSYLAIPEPVGSSRPVDGPPAAPDQSSVLVVSDRPHLLAEIEQLLAAEFDVKTVQGAASGLLAYASGRFDLLLVDNAISNGTGLDLLACAQRLHQGTGRVVLVDPGETEPAHDALSRGLVHAGVSLPLRADSLLDALRGAAAQARRARNRAAVLKGLRVSGLDIRRRQLGLAGALKRAIRLLLLQNGELEEGIRQLGRRNREIEYQANTDILTGLFNRRAIEGVAEYEVGRRLRYPGPLAIGLIDADHFKEINRRYLHPGGDQALIGLAQALSGSLRAADRVGRIGGEEFLVVSPQTDVAGATALAERLRATVAQAPISYNDQPIALTVSIGFAVIDTRAIADYNRLKHVAAEALAEAKMAGRNCSIIRTICALSQQAS